MIHKLRHLIWLFVIYLLLLTGGLLLVPRIGPGLSTATYTSLLTWMTLITIGAYVLVTLGRNRKEADQGILLLAGLGGKFVAYLILILIYWAVGKNLTMEFIIAFFVLYLLLTIFLVSTVYKVLNNK